MLVYLEHFDCFSQVLVGLQGVRVVLECDVPRVVVSELHVHCLWTTLVREQGLKQNSDCTVTVGGQKTDGIKIVNGLVFKYVDNMVPGI